MINSEQYKLVNDLISYMNDNSSSASETMKFLLSRYIETDTTKRVSDLLDFIPVLAKAQLTTQKNRIASYREAVDLMMVDIALENKDKRHANHKSGISTMIHVCKAHFPNGVCTDMRCSAEKDYFNSFIDHLKNQKEDFDYDDISDWYWISNTLNCREWMIDVIHKNIDENWKEPERR